MDYSYLTPRHTQQLYDDVIRNTVIEYRRAAEMLARNQTPAGEVLRHQLMQAIDALEQELAQRTRL